MKLSDGHQVLGPAATPRKDELIKKLLPRGGKRCVENPSGKRSRSSKATEEPYEAHFELLPSSALSAAQSRLLSSLTPEFNNLLARVETHLDRLERREQALIARCELLEGRLSTSGDDTEALRKSSSGIGRKSFAGDGDESREALRLKQMKAKKERLGYTVERLSLQAQQRERQLRKSVATQ
ncbi:MAG: hypothetical protein Q9220_005166 [cf. Caloplaca sp. 1 TL-2023]